MMLDEFIARMDNVRPTGRGMMAKCPAHEDKSPSLSIREAEDGRILIYCYAGCSPQAIVSSLGLTLSDLFPDALQPRHARPLPPARPRLDRNQIAFRLRFHGDKLFLRAQDVLDAATKLDITPWTTDQLDQALHAVALAYEDRERADIFDDVAVELRRKVLSKEVERYAA